VFDFNEVLDLKADAEEAAWLKKKAEIDAAGKK